jgi:hypothetical protein
MATGAEVEAGDDRCGGGRRRQAWRKPASRGATGTEGAMRGEGGNGLRRWEREARVAAGSGSAR